MGSDSVRSKLTIVQGASSGGAGIVEAQQPKPSRSSVRVRSGRFRLQRPAANLGTYESPLACRPGGRRAVFIQVPVRGVMPREGRTHRLEQHKVLRNGVTTEAVATHSKLKAINLVA